MTIRARRVLFREIVRQKSRQMASQMRLRESFATAGGCDRYEACVKVQMFFSTDLLNRSQKISAKIFFYAKFNDKRYAIYYIYSF